MKTCNQCKQTKEFTEFHKNKRKPDGHQERCKTCRSAYRAEYYKKNKEKEDKLKNEWFKKPENKAKVNMWHRQHKKRHRAYYAHITNQRRARKLERTVAWADIEKIKQVYAEATKLREQGHDVHVDHIVPLQGENVSGLHVHYNLQIIDAKENLQKSNKFVDEDENTCYNI